MTIQGSSENLFEIQKKEINGNNIKIAFNSAIREMFFFIKILQHFNDTITINERTIYYWTDMAMCLTIVLYFKILVSIQDYILNCDIMEKMFKLKYSKCTS